MIITAKKKKKEKKKRRIEFHNVLFFLFWVEIIIKSMKKTGLEKDTEGSEKVI